MVALPPGEADAPTHQALGWKLHRWSSHTVFGHDGGATGQGSFLRVVPERDAGLVLLANTVPNAMRLWSDLSSWFYRSLGIEVPERLAPQPGAQVEQADLGVYRCRDATFTVTGDGDSAQLRMEAWSGTRDTTADLRPLGQGVYRASPPLVDLRGLVSFEVLDDGARFVHCGPFTASRAP